MNWSELISDFERNNHAPQIAMQAISEPLESSLQVNPHPHLNVRLFHDNCSHVTHFKRPGGSELESVHPGFLFSPDSGFRKVVTMLREKPFVLILEEDRTEKTICWQDLNRLPFAAWLFGQISFLETMLKIQVKHTLETLELSRGLTWRGILTENELERVDENLSRLISENAETHFLDALTFHQLRKLVSRLFREKLPLVTQSRKQVDHAMDRINKVRNATAHARPILRKEDELGELAKTLTELAALNEELASKTDVLEILTSTRYEDCETKRTFTVGDVLPGHLDTICFITAWNPRSELLSEEENAKRNAELERNLVQLNMKYHPAVWVDPFEKWPSEPSFCIYDATFNEVHSIAQNYQQGTFCYADRNTPFRICMVQ